MITKTQPIKLVKLQTWMHFAVHILGFVPLLLISLALLTGSLSDNPIQEIEQLLGWAAFYFLFASLAVSPVISLTGWESFGSLRPIFGFYTFFHAGLHLIVFIALDFGFDFVEICRLVSEKPFILIGLIAGILILLLTIISLKIFRKKNWWKHLHKINYITGLLVIIHYALVQKGNLWSMQGNLQGPYLWGGLFLCLLLLRIVPIRQLIKHKYSKNIVKKNSNC